MTQHPKNFSGLIPAKDLEWPEVKAPFVRSPYNYDLKAASDAAGLDCSVDGPGKTSQAFAEEADINTLIRRFGIGNPLPQGTRVPSYGDFNGVTDYQSALNLLNQADKAFMALPADLRSRFGNSAAAFVAFVDDDSNRDEAIRLGMVPKPVVEAPVVPPVDASKKAE